MFRTAFRKEVTGILKKSPFFAHCEEESKPSLIEQADARLEGDRLKISTPASYENLKNVFNQASVPAYDGFRMILQKQVNLNTVVSHFYWIGSQATGQPIYQYRIILPFDEKLINVASDVAMTNVEGEVRVPLSSNVTGKVTFVLGEQSQGSGEVEITDESSNTLLQYSTTGDCAASYMQAVTPKITLGGTGSYSGKVRSLTTGLAAMFNDGENAVTAQWDENVRLIYVRKVNPNRVHLMTDFTLDAAGNSQMSLSAEYYLKQSKLHMGVDSNLQIKSLVEASLGAGMQLQFCADVNQLQGAYRFGYGLVIGN